VCKADNLTTFTCLLFWNLGVPNSWNPQCLSRPVMGLLFICFVISDLITVFHASFVGIFINYLNTKFHNLRYNKYYDRVCLLS
jgi:hypothetical protein